MIAVSFYLITAMFGIQSLYTIIIKKKALSVNTALMAGIYFPLILYLAGWSDKIESTVADEFYLIFIYLGAAGILFTRINSNYNLPEKFPEYDLNKYAPITVDIISIFFITCYFLENYIGSGSFIPSLNGQDIHTYSAPIISYITRSANICFIFEFLVFIKDKNKRHIFFALLVFIIPVITRNSRMTAIISACECIMLALFYLITRKKNLPLIKRNKNLKTVKNIFILCITAITLIVLLKFFVALTELRWSQWGKYEVSYRKSIGYTGPEFFGDIISVYYGYFPLSFNNLNINILYRGKDFNYIGLYTYKSFYYGILQLDNILGINPYQPLEGQFVTSGVATVETGFYEMYYDYGKFCFLPIIIMLGISYFVYRRAGQKITCCL